MSTLNRVTIIGYLGADPEVRYTQAGTPVCNLSIATNESWLDDKEQKQERTEWHKVVVWGPSAEACGEYLDKGRQVAVEGKLQTREWEKDNVKRYTTEIVASSVIFLGSGKDKTEQAPPQQEAASAPAKKTFVRKNAKGSK